MADEAAAADYIRLSELWSGLSPMVGMQRAKEMTDQAVASCGLPRKPMYSLPEFKEICRELRRAGGAVAMLVGAMAAKLIVTEREHG
jgi:hypothetical protein